MKQAAITLELPPVGVKILEKPDPARAAVPRFKGVSYCQAVLRATFGHELVVEPSSIVTCQWVPVVLGFKERENEFEKSINIGLPAGAEWKVGQAPSAWTLVLCRGRLSRGAVLPRGTAPVPAAVAVLHLFKPFPGVEVFLLLPHEPLVVFPLPFLFEFIARGGNGKGAAVKHPFGFAEGAVNLSPPRPKKVRAADRAAVPAPGDGPRFPGEGRGEPRCVILESGVVGDLSRVRPIEEADGPQVEADGAQGRHESGVGVAPVIFPAEGEGRDGGYFPEGLKGVVKLERAVGDHLHDAHGSEHVVRHRDDAQVASEQSVPEPADVVFQIAVRSRQQAGVTALAGQHGKFGQADQFKLVGNAGPRRDFFRDDFAVAGFPVRAHQAQDFLLHGSGSRDGC